MNEKAWEIVNEIKKDLREDERMVIFCHSVKRCEELVEMLKCEMYHSRYGGKSEGLATWMGGKQQSDGGDERTGNGD